MRRDRSYYRRITRFYDCEGPMGTLLVLSMLVMLLVTLPFTTWLDDR